MSFDKTFAARCAVAPIGRVAASRMIASHYLHKWPSVPRLWLGLLCDNRAVGLIVFALPPRETEIRYGGPVWELARLWVDDLMPRNTESWFIAKAIAFIKANFRHLRGIVSYADPAFGHRGTIYRATNWLYEGLTDAERKTPRFDYVLEDGVRCARRGHIVPGQRFVKVRRPSKHRFFLPLAAKGEGR